MRINTFLVFNTHCAQVTSKFSLITFNLNSHRRAYRRVMLVTFKGEIFVNKRE